ncbi:MAG: envelope stress response membrane protein PspC [Inquilinus sp.]|nr:envelope stress response membrane protein PspC [Inquilinus sp.]
MTGTDRSPDSPNPHRLYRNTEDGVILGVCAGVADYFGIERWQSRTAAGLFLLFFPPWAVFFYLLAAIFLPRRPPRPYRDQDEEAFWRSVTGRPDRTLSELHYNFRTLEERLAGLERHVTSEEFRLHRAFRDLE